VAARLFPPTPCERLNELLCRYISKILVRSVLTASLSRIGVLEADVRPRELERLVEEAMLGLRLWVPADRLPDLMLELAELCMELQPAPPAQPPRRQPKSA
jgi:hypothetical protein